MKGPLPLFLFCALILLAGVSVTYGEEAGLFGEFGDAPEGAMAYPTLGVLGQFPTCLAGPAGSFIFHAASPGAFFGPTIDSEGDGNAGFCPPPPYDQDECSPAVDNDAGLTIPEAYTIAGGAVTTCGLNGSALGVSCANAAWGANIDIRVTNATGIDMMVNVLIDWDQNGQWGGSSPCPAGIAPEWVLRNFLVPAGFGGPLSLLVPPGFRIGPNDGFFWTRISIAEALLPGPDWDGSGSFQFGETEDYLLRVDAAQPIPLEYGDAPEGVIAYPSIAVFGSFPTCNGGPAGVIQHGAVPVAVNAHFGPGIDFELDGNGGICPPAPYENDECWAAVDGDAGLTTPDTYTIAGGIETSCSGGASGLPGPCQPVNWGLDLDIVVRNNTGAGVFVNALADWNHDGVWGGVAGCAVGAHEYFLRDFIVPAGYAGLLSALAPPGFNAGPLPGFCWFRFTVSETPINANNWNGTGAFQLGETEDYLLRVNGSAPQGDYGDAPEGTLAYPSGVIGRFPTCVLTGPAGFIQHGTTANCWLGPVVDFEGEGNGGTCAWPPYDRDECAFTTGDAGLINPEPYTLTAAGTAQPCPLLQGTPLGWRCLTESRWGVQVDVNVTNTNPFNVWLNVLVDWNQDGQWSGSMGCPGVLATPEHLVQNVPIFAGHSGKLSDIFFSSFWIPSQPGYVWTRFTISENPVPANWDGSGSFQDGETEDYLLRVDDAVSGAGDPHPPVAGKLLLESASPNPFNPSTTIRWRMEEPGEIRLTIHDITGRIVRTLVEDRFEAGPHTAAWDGTDDRGLAMSSGIYVVRVTGGTETRTMKISMVK